MDLKFSRDASGSAGARKPYSDATECVRVIHYENDFPGTGFNLVNEIPYLSAVNSSTGFLDEALIFPLMRLYEAEDAGSSVALIRNLQYFRFYGQWLSHFTKELVWLFIHAPERLLRIIGLLI